MASLGPEKRVLRGLPWHCALGRSNPTTGVANFASVSGPSWPAWPMGRALVWESGDHVSRPGSESYCMTLACHFSVTLTFSTLARWLRSCLAQELCEA